MTVEEVFAAISGHMQKGIQMHKDMMEAFDFLALDGYMKCQEYHYLSELKEHLELCHYYMENYCKLIKVDTIETMEVIPSSWYKHERLDVDTSTKRTAIRDIMKKWLDWEVDTKKFLQEMFRELDALNEVAAASYIEDYINDVAAEVVEARKKFILLESSGYDIVEIVREQDQLKHFYKKKIKTIN